MISIINIIYDKPSATVMSLSIYSMKQVQYFGHQYNCNVRYKYKEDALGFVLQMAQHAGWLDTNLYNTQCT